MAVVTSDLLASTLTGVKAIFNDGFLGALGGQNWLNLVLDKKAIDSAGHENMDYSWLGSIPKMERWRGSLNLGALTPYSYSLTNYLYTAGFDVERLALERDQLGLIVPKTNQLIQEAARYPGDLIFDLLNNGATGLAFDGVEFFDNTRVLGTSANIDNILVSAGTSVANFRTDLATARSTMMAYQDDKGRAQNVAPNVVLIHPAESAIAYEALVTGPGANEPGVMNAAGAPSGSPVWQARGYTVVEDARITDTGARYFMHVSPGLAPFLFQTEVAPSIEGITTPNSESGVIFERFVYKTRWVGAVGYGDPRLAIIVT